VECKQRGHKRKPEQINARFARLSHTKETLQELKRAVPQAAIGIEVGLATFVRAQTLVTVDGHANKYHQKLGADWEVQVVPATS